MLLILPYDTHHDPGHGPVSQQDLAGKTSSGFGTEQWALPAACTCRADCRYPFQFASVLDVGAWLPQQGDQMLWEALHISWRSNQVKMQACRLWAVIQRGF